MGCVLPLCTFAATLIVLFVGFIQNNSRITEFRTDIGRRIEDLKKLIDAKLGRQEEILLGKIRRTGQPPHSH